jgi:hypothetical protein
MFPKSIPHSGHGLIDTGPIVFGTDGHLPRLTGRFQTRPTQPEETHRAIDLEMTEQIQSGHRDRASRPLSR